MNREDADANGAARQRAGQGTPTPRAKRKKARLPAPPSAPSQPDPVSEPYLVRAPPPVTAAPPETSNSGLILPSAYVRSVTQHRYAHGLVSPPSVMAGGSGENTPRPLPTPTPPAATQRDYVTGLLSPPFVVPGGRPSSPLPQPPVAPSRPPLPHTGSSSRSVNRGRELPPIGGRQSPMPSTSNANPPPPAEPPTPRRRRGGRHVVSGTISRRSTVRVSHHEHLQLSRQASMRRTNVWDDLPDATDPPPPFPFPTPSNSRLPPTFSPVDTASNRGSDVTSQGGPPRPYSPPPPFEQAIQAQGETASCPSSPSGTLEEEEEDAMFMTDEQREDRRMWNADILAGYSLEARVARENERRAARLAANANMNASATPSANVANTRSDPAVDRPLTDAERATRAEIEAAIREINGSKDTSKDELERAARQALEALGGKPASKQEILRVAREALAAKGGKLGNHGADTIIPTTPATIIESNTGRRPVLERQEEPGVYYRVVIEGQKGSKTIDEVRQQAQAVGMRPRTPSQSESFHQSSLRSSTSPGPSEGNFGGPSTSSAPRPREGPRETLSTVDDIASIYGLSRPGRNTSGPSMWQSQPRAVSPAGRIASNPLVSSPPPNTSSLPKRQESRTPPIQGSPRLPRSESPLRAITPQLQRNDSFNLPSPGLGGFARSTSPLNARSVSPQAINRSASIQASMSNPDLGMDGEDAAPGELRTKKEILEALERAPKPQVEPPKPIMIANREGNNVAIVSRSEEPGVLYRFMPANPNANVNAKAANPRDALQRSPSPKVTTTTRPAFGHIRSSSQSQIPTLPGGAGGVGGGAGQLRLHRAPKTMVTDPTPIPSTHPPPERYASYSGGTASLPRRLPTAQDVFREERSSPAPPAAPPLPPRPPLEYITEYKTCRSPAPMMSVPSGSESSLHAHRRSASPPGHASSASASAPSPVTENALTSTSSISVSPRLQSSERLQSSDRPPTGTSSYPGHLVQAPPAGTSSYPGPSVQAPPPMSSPPAIAKRAALPRIPSSSSIKSAPPAPAASRKPPSGLFPEPAQMPTHSGVAGLGFQQSTVGGRPMPTVASPPVATPQANAIPPPPVPNTGFASTPLTVATTEDSGVSAYSSLTAAPGSGSYPSQSSPRHGRPTSESPATSWLKRFGSADRLSIRSTSSTSTSQSVNAPSHASRHQQQGSSLARSDENGRAIPTQAETKSSGRPRWMRRTSTDKHDKQDSTGSSGRISPHVSTGSHEPEKPLFSEPWRSPRKRTNTSPVVGSQPEWNPVVRYRHSHAEGVTRPVLSALPTPQERDGLPPQDRFDELEELHNEPAMMFLASASPNRPTFAHQLPPGAQPSAFSPPLPALPAEPPAPPPRQKSEPLLKSSEPPRNAPELQTRSLSDSKFRLDVPPSQAADPKDLAFPRSTPRDPALTTPRAATPQPVVTPVPAPSHVTAAPQESSESLAATTSSVEEHRPAQEVNPAYGDRKGEEPMAPKSWKAEATQERPREVPVTHDKVDVGKVEDQKDEEDEEEATIVVPKRVVEELAAATKNAVDASPEQRMLDKEQRCADRREDRDRYDDEHLADHEDNREHSDLHDHDSNDEHGHEVAPTFTPRTMGPPLLPPLFSQSYDPSPSLAEETPSSSTAVETGPTTPVKDTQDESVQQPHVIRLDENGNLIPPAREAALMRRDLYAPSTDISQPPTLEFSQSTDWTQSTSSVDLSQPSDTDSRTGSRDSTEGLNFRKAPRPLSIAAGKRPAPPPPPPRHSKAAHGAGPLLAVSTNHLTAPNPPSPSMVSPDIVSLAGATSALLNLLEAEDTRPVAESSAQGASRAALSQHFRFELAQQREIEAQIHESLERAQNRQKELPKTPPRDDKAELSDYGRGPYAELPEKLESEEDVFTDDGEVMNDSHSMMSNRTFGTGLRKGHSRSLSQQHPPSPAVAPGISRSRSHSNSQSSPSRLVQPSSSNASSRSDLSAMASSEVRRRAPGPPPARPPPPPPPKAAPSRPPPPPPPSRRGPSGRPPPPPPPPPKWYPQDTTEEMDSPSSPFQPPGAFQFPPASPQRRLLDPLSAPSTVWKNPRFVSPLDPHPPEPSWTSATDPPPPVPTISKSHYELIESSKASQLAKEQQDPQPRSAMPNLSAPDTPNTPLNGPSSAPPAHNRQGSVPTNPSMWHMHPPQRPTNTAAPATAHPPAPPPPRRPPPPVPPRNSSEFLSPGPVQGRHPPHQPGMPSYSSSSSSLVDLEGASVTPPVEGSRNEARDSGDSSLLTSTPPRGSSRSPLPSFPKPPMRWATKNVVMTPNGSHPVASSPPATAAANRSSGSTTAEHSSEYHTGGSSISHSQPTQQQQQPQSHFQTQQSQPADLPSPPATSSTATATPGLRAPSERSLEITDLDVFVSRLEGSGREYEGLSHLTEFLGPAKVGASEKAISTLLPSLVEVESRRINAKGKVKLKLSVLGVRVANCPICLAQFRGGDAAVLLPRCGHVSHESCARRWFRESDLCMVCRTPLEMET